MKKRVLATVAVLAISALVLSACSSKSGSVTNMNVKDFATKIQQAGVVTVDVRTPGEFVQGHIQGAVNIDVEASTFDSEIAKLDKTKTYAVYCHSGNRSGIATAAMAKAGFTHVFNLQNGILDWIGQGMPVVTS
jgi:phage shock protein E